MKLCFVELHIFYNYEIIILLLGHIQYYIGDALANLASSGRSTYLFVAMVQAIPSFLVPLQMLKSAEMPIFIICLTEPTLTENPCPCKNIVHQQ